MSDEEKLKDNWTITVPCTARKKRKEIRIRLITGRVLELVITIG